MIISRMTQDYLEVLSFRIDVVVFFFSDSVFTHSGLISTAVDATQLMIDVIQVKLKKLTTSCIFLFVVL